MLLARVRGLIIGSVAPKEPVLGAVGGVLLAAKGLGQSQLLTLALNLLPPGSAVRVVHADVDVLDVAHVSCDELVVIKVLAQGVSKCLLAVLVDDVGSAGVQLLLSRVNHGSVTLGRGMNLVASFLLKLGLAAVAALPPPKALGLKVAKGGLKLRILAVLDGLLPQCIGKGPKPSQWPGLGWIFDKGKVLIHDGTLELRRIVQVYRDALGDIPV